MANPDPAAESLLAHPERGAVLLQVGECLAAWSQVEHHLLLVFLALTHGTDPGQMGAAFEAVISFEARLAMVDALVERDSDRAFCEAWNALSNKLTRLHRRRHQVAHFSIVHHEPDTRPFLHPFFSLGRRNVHTPLSADQLKNRAASFLRACGRLNRLKMYLLHRAGKLAADRLPAGDPAQLLRAPSAPTHEETSPPSPPSAE
jgi:hypothetical protein